MSWFCCYSVIRRGATALERSSNMTCYAQWAHALSQVDKVVVHIPMSDVQTNNSCHTDYTNKQLVRYFRALQRAGFQFKFSGNNNVPPITTDYYGRLLKPECISKGHSYVKCYNIDIDLTKCSHMNAQIVMFCVRFLYEKTLISKTFLRFLDDERKAKKHSGSTIFDKMLIAMLCNAGAGHSFGANTGYNLLLSKERFKKVITDSKTINETTSRHMPKTIGGPAAYGEGSPGRRALTKMIVDATHPFEEVLKVYKEECAKYM